MHAKLRGQMQKAFLCETNVKKPVGETGKNQKA
jgi:hypothetical protein